MQLDKNLTAKQLHEALGKFLEENPNRANDEVFVDVVYTEWVPDEDGEEWPDSKTLEDVRLNFLSAAKYADMLVFGAEG